MKPVKERVLKVLFNADTHASMQWNFRPQQTEIYVRTAPPSELTDTSHLSCLIWVVCMCLWLSWSLVKPRWLFIEPKTRQTNPSSVSPPTTWFLLRLASTLTRSRYQTLLFSPTLTMSGTFELCPLTQGLISFFSQCFCFEEQRLNPHEEVDMPVFFYIDPEFDEDPRMARVNTITLSYTFFEAKEGQSLPLPGYSYKWGTSRNQEQEQRLEERARIILVPEWDLGFYEATNLSLQHVLGLLLCLLQVGHAQ